MFKHASSAAMLAYVFLLSSLSANAEICGPKGERAAEHESKGDFTTAVWCYTNAQNWRPALALQKRLVPSALPRIGEGNFAGMISQFANAHLGVGELSAGRRVIEQGVAALGDSPQAIHVAYNVSKLFHDPTMSFAERQKWHRIFMRLMKLDRPQNQIADCFTANVYFGVDRGVRERKSYLAFAMARDAVESHDADMKKFWGYLRDMIQIQYLALKQEATPRRAQRKLKMLFVVVPETKLATGHPQFGNVDEKLQEADVQELLLNFRYFASAFQAMTGIGWEAKIIRHRGAVTKSTFISDPPRSVMHADMTSIDPPFSASLLNEIAASDGVTLIWAGTRQPPGHLITNGSGTEYGFPIGGKHLVRLLILSDSNKRYLDGNHANSALFFFHELFHVLEWAYYKSPFPSAEHSFMRRNLWPADFEGSTEWDFYYETFTKRFVPEDGLNRVEWRSNHEGFYNKKAAGR
jgi:hypothetical protein